MAIVVGLGELLWDLLPDGKTLGGAPANFAHHAAELGHRAFIASRVGDDPLGRELLGELGRRGLDATYVQVDPSHPTGTVPVRVAADGTPTFSIVPDVAWDYLQSSAELHDLLKQADLVCAGTLAQRSPGSREAIGQLLGCSGCPVLFDANLRHRFWSAELLTDSLRRATIVKVNEREWSRLVELGLAPGSGDRIGACRALLERFELGLVCLTRGAAGCLLVATDGAATHPGFEVPVVDTVGCGDAFAAAVAHGWLAGQPLDDIARDAARLGAWVASQRGATPKHPAPWPELRPAADTTRGG